LKTQSAISHLLFVGTFIRFAENSFQKRQAATCCFSKEFCENPGNVPTKRKKGIKIQKRIMQAHPVFKRVLHNSKAFGVKQLRT
jgi:hypothetical protein